MHIETVSSAAETYYIKGWISSLPKGKQDIKVRKQEDVLKKLDHKIRFNLKSLFVRNCCYCTVKLTKLLYSTTKKNSHYH